MTTTTTTTTPGPVTPSLYQWQLNNADEDSYWELALTSGPDILDLTDHPIRYDAHEEFSPRCESRLTLQKAGASAVANELLAKCTICLVPVHTTTTTTTTTTTSTTTGGG